MSFPKGMGVAAFVLMLIGCAGQNAATIQAVVPEKADQMPVAATREAPPELLKNAGFESGQVSSNGRPEGWWFEQHAGPRSYEFVVDGNVHHSGARAQRIRNIGPEPYGAVQQSVRAASLQGKTVKVSAWLKTEAVDGKGAGLTVKAMGGGGILAHDFMLDALVRGTQDWKRYGITMPVPEGALELRIGVMLQGKGTVWADDFEIEILP